jgi:hypothetical protein
MLNPYFSRERMAGLEAPLRRFAGEMIDQLLAVGNGDFAVAFSHPFPTGRKTTSSAASSEATRSCRRSTTTCSSGS